MGVLFLFLFKYTPLVSTRNLGALTFITRNKTR